MMNSNLFKNKTKLNLQNRLLRCICGAILVSLFCAPLSAQIIPLPTGLPETHPRLMTTQENKEKLLDQIANEEWVKEVYQGILKRVDPILENTKNQPDWLYSRLMMYWTSRATNVYIKGGVYSHADGEAPIPTVRFGSTRGVSSVYKRPKIADIVPYMDDTKGVYFHNSAKDGNPLEWTDASNASGSNIESINEEIMKLAKDAAFIYWLTDDVAYGKLAFDVFHTYMLGMYYRSEPIDISTGHAQTLVGLSTFEVIQERILNELAYTYDFLYGYIAEVEASKGDELKKLSIDENLRSVYESVLKKWIGLTIKNGVPHNNWNLHQAKFILKVAMVLNDDTSYADGKGRSYYINAILNKTTPRQWSMADFMSFGYDMDNGIWNECPGYAIGVTKDLTNFIRDYDNTFQQNILPYVPVMKKAVEVIPQYIFPNRKIAAFGDTYYIDLNTEAFSDMIRMAQKYNNREDEVLFTKMYRLFEPNADVNQTQTRKLPAQIASLFTTKPLELDKTIEKGELKEFLTPTFYAPNVSWFVQRNQFDDAQNGMMISQVASFGNHAHSNGLSMEMYGKGYILGADPGIGSSYFEKPYLEFYSQFPAHNTVMVDGISKYPEMLSNHPFDLLSCYPQSGQKDGLYNGITFSDIYFLEPESRSDQNRLMSIVRTSPTQGYYVDIFRSKKQRAGDKFHDYFYHNLGQEMFVQDAKGNELELTPSEEMAFAGGHLFALDYMWDKRSIRTNKDYQAVWKMTQPNSNHVYMNLWMKGYKGREVFSIKSPPCKSFRGEHKLPYEVASLPYLTIAARQHGEAWKHPFVSIFEPTTEEEGRSIASIESFEPAGVSDDFVGLMVKSKSGRVDYIFSSVADEKISYNGMSANATYALVSQQGSDFTLFLGNGTEISANGFSIESLSKTNAVLEYKNGEYYLTCEAPIVLKTAKKKKGIKYSAISYQKIQL